MVAVAAENSSGTLWSRLDRAVALEDGASVTTARLRHVLPSDHRLDNTCTAVVPSEVDERYSSSDSRKAK